MVFYRKYRPQKIDDLDSKAVRDTLLSVLAKNPPHAFLFTGPKGLGKTSTARIIAKAVNCMGRAVNKEQRTASNAAVAKNKESKGKVLSSQSHVQSIIDIEPCNECEQCISITNGTNMDVLEIDAASNRGIDEIRDLKEKIRLAPFAAKKKVYIIDEVHMLTTEAFNALLKTLEEPPEHVMFILCTTEPHKVPATILSRCFHITFKPATEEELIRSFKRIVKGEGIKVSDEALSEIARLSEGGFRDGTKILEEMASVANGKEITKELIEEKYRVSSVKYQVTAMIAALEKRDTKAGLQVVIQLVEQGADSKYFLDQLLTTLHEALLVKVGIESPSAPLRVRGESIKLDIEALKQLLQLLTKAYGEMKYAVIPQLPLELAIIEWGEEAQKNVEPHDNQHTSASHSVKSSDEDVKITTASVRSGKNEVSLTTMRKQVGNIAKIKALYGESAVKGDKEEPIAVSAASVSLLHYSPTGEITPEWLDTFWKCLISEMKKHNHTIAGVLRSCMIKDFDRKNLIIEAAYKFHKERLDEIKTRTVLEKAAKELLGSPIAVSIILKEGL